MKKICAMIPFVFLFLCLSCKKESARTIDLLSQYENSRSTPFVETENGKIAVVEPGRPLTLYERVRRGARFKVDYELIQRSAPSMETLGFRTASPALGYLQ